MNVLADAVGRIAQARVAIAETELELGDLILRDLGCDLCLVGEALDDEPDVERLRRAVLLAPTLEACEALLLGEQVPLDRLDPVQVRRFGIRDR